MNNINLERLRITEIFLSLQGETRTVGIPTVFVRLTGCPLRCQYCDTAYAFKGGKMMEIADILQQVQGYYARHVTVTGGEPLAQPGCINLLRELCDLDYEVSLETSGAMDVSKVDSRVVKVLDLKTPGSKEMHRNLYSNVQYLTPIDQVKFVICDYDDFLWSKEQVFTHKLLEKKCEVLFSPSFGQIQNRDLAQWILDAQLPVRMQLQAHKYIWGNEQGR